MARVAPAAQEATPQSPRTEQAASNVVPLARRGATAHEAPKVSAAEAMTDRVSRRLDERRSRSEGEDPFLSHTYSRRRELGWILPDPAGGSQRNPQPEPDPPAAA